MLPALETWVAKNGEAAAPSVYGQNLTCPSHDDPSCRGLLHPETQHYGYNVLALHLLAVCYYAQEHGEEAAFETWVRWTQDGGYCTAFEIPSKGTL